MPRSALAGEQEQMHRHRLWARPARLIGAACLRRLPLSDRIWMSRKVVRTDPHLRAGRVSAGVGLHQLEVL